MSPLVLEKVLLGREERSREQARLLRSAPVVVQVALNVPGLPKEVEGGREVVSAVACRLERAVASASERLFLRNGAGEALLLAFGALSPGRLKKEALGIEEGRPWGRILDVDVLTAQGAVSRGDLGCPPRSCLLCSLPAKICARQARHSLDELRRTFLLLMEGALADEELFSPSLYVPFPEGRTREKGRDRP